MSETRFMKGPWRAEKGRYGWQISTAWPGFELNHWIANIKCESCPAHEVDTAHLIAAAPALYEALEPFANVYEDACDDEPDERSLWDHAAAMGIKIADLRAACRALSLARGEKNDG